jgi:exocyst complex component 4
VVVLTGALKDDTSKQLQLCSQETQLELELLGHQAISQKNVIPSLRNLAEIAALYDMILPN